MVSREWSRALQGPLPALGKKAIEGEGRMLKWEESAALIVGVVMAAGAAAMPLPAEKGAVMTVTGVASVSLPNDEAQITVSK